MKKMAIVLKANVVRKNLFSCFRDTALMWHTVELSDITKKILTYEKGVKEWMQIFSFRFKFQASTATAVLLKEKYIIKNARKHREPKKYAQKIIR